MNFPRNRIYNIFISNKSVFFLLINCLKNSAYIQFLVLKKTLELISFERRRGLEEKDEFEEISALAEKLKEKRGEETAIPSFPKEEN